MQKQTGLPGLRRRLSRVVYINKTMTTPQIISKVLPTA